MHKIKKSKTAKLHSLEKKVQYELKHEQTLSLLKNVILVNNCLFKKNQKTLNSSLSVRFMTFSVFRSFCVKIWLSVQEAIQVF